MKSRGVHAQDQPTLGDVDLNAVARFNQHNVSNGASLRVALLDSIRGPAFVFALAVAICYSCTMSSMPLRIDGELIHEAKVSGHVFHRSIAQQVEHWASLGRVLEKVLTVSSVAKVKNLSRPVDLECALAGARSAAGRKKTLALLARKQGPLYGVKPDRPGGVLQYEPGKIAVASEMIEGKFVRTRKVSKTKTSR